MDFPIDLTKPYVQSMEELRQTLYILFKTEYGTFLQSDTLGNKMSVHGQLDSDVRQLAVESIVQQIPGCSLVDFSDDNAEKNPTIKLRIMFKGDVKDFTFLL